MRAKEIADDIQSNIQDDDWKLPTMRELTVRYNTSSRTIAQAIDKLKARDVVYTRPGKGIYIKKRS
jgi:DNA-binding GntR family transcriptional regulator